ncbi:sugar ABC transporter substrate-binding protein [Alicyclobacillus hesperidum subsp. aegles]|uniref:ABC transporter substrate-binding protein n=1 Tax=Alicyclobacillus hesperidum TaxID=89784 RepID=UPI000310DCFF|nr:ABC transporter substrate-binding protein [Alicyclobacillus hesperidum]GLG01902.1 sugar ABC transporter substrate-binding protein [Alicyclobacillus hesperidum subsp. aegles]
MVKQQWQRACLFVSASALTVGVVSGCGTTDTGAASSTTTPTKNAAASSQKITITEMDYYTGSLASQGLNDIEKEFEKTHPNIIIQRIPVPYTELLPKSLQEAQTHTLPTMVICDNLNIPTMVAAGALTPLTKLGTIDKSQYLAGPLKTVTVNNQIYGLPVGSNDLALFYNKKMLSAAHISPPKTWSQLLTDSKKLSKGSVYGMVFSAPNNEQATWQFAPFLWTNGGSYTQFSSARAIQAIQLWETLVKEGGASPSVVNYSQNDVYDEFASGHAAMMEMGPWEIPSLKAAHVDYGVVQLPVPKLGQKAISPIGGEDWTITNDGSPAQQKAAWEFIHWLQQPQLLAHFDSLEGYVPAYIPAMQLLLKQDPSLKLFADELNNALPLTTGLGTQLPNVSNAVSTALQAAISGSQSPAQAAKTASQAIQQYLH